MHFKPFKLLLCGVLCWFEHPKSAFSETATYTIQSSSWIKVVESTFDANSNVLTGTKILSTIGVKEQSTGSLRSQISGSLSADVSGPSFTFSPSDIDVLPNPQRPFLPSIPSSPGQEDNFGAITLHSFDGEENCIGYANVLDVTTRLTGGTAVLGSKPSNLSFSLTYGILNRDIDDVQGFDFLGPSSPVENLTTDQFTVAADGTIHIPFYIEFPSTTFINTVLIFKGEIIASRVTAMQTGDYNQDNKVNAADYVLWRNGDIRADGSGNGSVGPEDYGYWRNNFGSGTGGLGTSDGNQGVPEPSCFALLVSTLICAASSQMRKRKYAYQD